MSHFGAVSHGVNHVVITRLSLPAALLCTGTQLALSMKCNKIDVVISKGSGILLQDDTVLAREGQPLYIGCYCRFMQYTRAIHSGILYVQECNVYMMYSPFGILY